MGRWDGCAGCQDPLAQLVLVGRLDRIGDGAGFAREPDDSSQESTRVVGIDRVFVALRGEVPIGSRDHVEPGLELKSRGPSLQSKLVPVSLEDAHGLGRATGIRDCGRRHGASPRPGSRGRNHAGVGEEKAAGRERAPDLAATLLGSRGASPLLHELAHLQLPRLQHLRDHASPEPSLVVKDGKSHGANLAHQDRVSPIREDLPGVVELARALPMSPPVLDVLPFGRIQADQGAPRPGPGIDMVPPLGESCHTRGLSGTPVVRPAYPHFSIRCRRT